VPLRTPTARQAGGKNRPRSRFSCVLGEERQHLPPNKGGIVVKDYSARNGWTPLDASNKPTPLHGRRATDGGNELRHRLADKWHIGPWGNLHVSFGKGPSRITTCATVYSAVRGLFRDALNKTLYITGGNLLGLVREGKFLDHDDDI